jgi:hypothetical protein
MPPIDPYLQTKILKELHEADLNEILVSVDGFPVEAFWYNARQLHRKGLIDIQDRATLDHPKACWATGLTPHLARNPGPDHALISTRPGPAPSPCWQHDEQVRQAAHRAA